MCVNSKAHKNWAILCDIQEAGWLCKSSLGRREMFKDEQTLITYLTLEFVTGDCRLSKHVHGWAHSLGILCDWTVVFKRKRQSIGLYRWGKVWEPWIFHKETDPTKQRFQEDSERHGWNLGIFLGTSRYITPSIFNWNSIG